MARLRGFQTPSLRGNALLLNSVTDDLRAMGGFKPLHCGAMLCCRQASESEEEFDGTFQTPSLRGNALLVFANGEEIKTFNGFKPLHCGAMLC